MPVDTRLDLVDIDGERCHVIDDVDALEPFLVALTSASDVWAFLTSNGGITAGRRNADHAMFPYVTEDLLQDSAGTTGGVTRLRILDGPGAGTTWHPFAATPPDAVPVRRRMMKSDLGDVVHLEESRPDLQASLRVSWRVSPRFGLVRTMTLTATGPGPRTVEVVDGLRNFLPPGVTARTQRELAPLLDAYKVTELDPSSLAWVRLNAGLSDRAEAAESLAVTTVWQSGLPEPQYALSGTALQHWQAVQPRTQVRGQRAAFLARSTVTVHPDTPLRWSTVIDVDQDAADVVALCRRLRDAPAAMADVESDIRQGRERLRALVASADGWTRSGSPMADAHHAASTMFNIMRGGVPVTGHVIDRDDVLRYLSLRNRTVAQRWDATLAALPRHLGIRDLRRAAVATGDPDLTRLVGEYLPLTFSRRHGDPSRPWNVFEIVLTGDDGTPRLAHQGNWRDIFQNWEALGWSFPDFTESMVRTFLNATTIDGYNPYRISREGVDWEVPEPENPWANIGYWSDHQIIYLARLLELLQGQHPQRLTDMLRHDACVHVDVPYVLATYDELLLDSTSTVAFDEQSHTRTMERVAALGSDGRLLTTADGSVRRASMPEKLLTLLVAKLANFVPEGGIWMNTQRPEWNDANNALVGRGLSVVTVAHLHRYVVLLERLLGVDVEVDVPPSLAEAITAMTEALSRVPVDGDPLDDGSRRAVLDALGAAGTAYRASARDDQGRVSLSHEALHHHLRLVRHWCGRTVRAARRADGLYDAYNLLTLCEDTARVEPMVAMLEGQVAVLSSGVLTRPEVLEVLAALPLSPLYRPDVDSYQLYPEAPVPGFLERNTIPGHRFRDNPLLRLLAERGDRRLVVVDVDGEAHFAAGIRNADDVREVLSRLEQESEKVSPAVAGLVRRERHGILAIFEEVFAHASYTGRSTSFFAYEGVGSVYWHMVSKLLLAVREHLDAALETSSVDSPDVRALHAAYDQVRGGLGFNRTAEQFGAFPHDPYSHTPAGHGARQPGMTGQVKEDMLARWADLGVAYVGGRIRIDARRVAPEDWTSTPTTFRGVDAHGEPFAVELPAGSIGLTVGQVPVTMHREAGGADGQVIALCAADGTVVEQAGTLVSLEASTALMSRDRSIARIEVRPRRPAGRSAGGPLDEVDAQDDTPTIRRVPGVDLG